MPLRGQTRTATRRPRVRPPPSSSSGSDSEPRPVKRRKTTSSSSGSKTSSAYQTILRSPAPSSLPPSRLHPLSYHYPLLLSSPSSRASFLSWFDSVAHARPMPWRQPFLPPSASRAALEGRAYQVWISEIMLQQTRVAAVVAYWTAWMAKWPTIQHLAAASPDDVLAAWRGLGYYSRATRIHAAAQLVVSSPAMAGLLPSAAGELAAQIPGVGRYTAGAISSIAFGRPAPMVDGNVLRVLSRQLGVHGNIKTDKAVVDMIWDAAEALVNAVALDGHPDPTAAPEDTRSDRPGRWGQALMELGSTVCTPRPNCGACPITATCRAYAEGLALTEKKPKITEDVADIEDVCTVCEPFDDAADDDIENQPPPPLVAARSKQATISAFFGKSTAPSKSSKVDMDAITAHARRFPLKTAKKPVRQEETLVCAILRSDGRVLVHKRPAKGLLAGLWEFPSSALQKTTSNQREQLAREFVAEILDDAAVEHVGELGSVPWLFSHIKLTMHVHLFRLQGTRDVGVGGAAKGRWSEDVEAESMGTGMRKCWELVKEAV